MCIACGLCVKYSTNSSTCELILIVTMEGVWPDPLYPIRKLRLKEATLITGIKPKSHLNATTPY